MVSTDNERPAGGRKRGTIIVVCTISNIAILYPSGCLLDRTCHISRREPINLRPHYPDQHHNLRPATAYRELHNTPLGPFRPISEPVCNDPDWIIY
jgi:hypothetical protein